MRGTGMVGGGAYQMGEVVVSECVVLLGIKVMRGHFQVKRLGLFASFSIAVSYRNSGCLYPYYLIIFFPVKVAHSLYWKGYFNFIFIKLQVKRNLIV